MKAVNLIPKDAQTSGRAVAMQISPATYMLVSVLIAGLVLAVLYVLGSNDVANRQAQITSLQAQVQQEQARAAGLKAYSDFASLAQSRLGTVQGIAATRFDWHQAMAELALVIPANTSLQSLSGTVVPGAGAGGGGGGGGGLRAVNPGPAFEFTGCTSTQDDVARLISRLRVMHNVTRVVLNSSLKSTSVSTTSSTSTTGAKKGCKANAPTFDILVFYKQINGAGAAGAASLGTAASTSTGATQ